MPKFLTTDEITALSGTAVVCYRYLKAPIDPATGRKAVIWSVAHADNANRLGKGKLIGHIRPEIGILLHNATGVVKASRAEALKGGHDREVCAWIAGTAAGVPALDTESDNDLRFDPQVSTTSFFHRLTQALFTRSAAVSFGKVVSAL